MCGVIDWIYQKLQNEKSIFQFKIGKFKKLPKSKSEMFYLLSFIYILSFAEILVFLWLKQTSFYSLFVIPWYCTSEHYTQYILSNFLTLKFIQTDYINA